MEHRILRLGDRLLDLGERPLVMGIVNVTPDSFYASSRVEELAQIRSRIDQVLSEGGDIVDLGAYSTRPGAVEVSEGEERERLRPALELLRSEYGQVSVSVDTFRASIARWAVEEYGVSMVNDVSGGTLDEEMFATVAGLQVPYILMHMRGTPQTMQSLTEYDDLSVAVLDYFVERVGRLREMGLHDVVLDPGFGFGKTLEQNYELMARMGELKRILGLPMLVGISRKSMIYRLLGTSADDALCGTVALHTYSLLHGADILRVHDVRQAVETITLVQMLQKHTPVAQSRICSWSKERDKG